jgi:hypothetical protein
MGIKLKTGATRPPQFSRAGSIISTAEMDEVSIGLLSTAIEAGNGFRLADSDQQELAAKLGKSKTEVSATLRVFDALYGALNDGQPPNRPLESQRNQIRDFLSSVPAITEVVEDVNELAKVLAPLLVQNDKIDVARKRERLREGLLPNAIGFTSFVDLRPHFSRSDEAVSGIIELVRQIQFVVHTDGIDPLLETIVLQLDDAGLKALRDAVKLLDQKIDVLNAHQLSLPIR